MGFSILFLYGFIGIVIWLCIWFSGEFVYEFMLFNRDDWDNHGISQMLNPPELIKNHQKKWG